MSAPRLAERLLRLALGERRFTDDLIGDLAEHHETESRRSQFAASFAYWRAAVPLVLRFAPSTALDALFHLVFSPRRRAPAREPGMSFWNQTRLDLRLSLRGLARRPGSSALVVLTLAVGLGANAAVFGILDALVLHPFRYDESDRIVHVSERTPANDPYDVTNLSPAAFLELREESRDEVEALVGYEWWDANVRLGEGPVQIQGFRASPELLDALRVRPALGRFFTSAESVAGGERVVVLGHELWERSFAADPAILGREVEIDGASHRVVGVAPAGFAFPVGAELWSPLAFDPAAAALRDRHSLGAFGRLRDGVSIDAANARFEVRSAERARLHPATDAGRVVVARTLAEGLRDAGVVPIFFLWQGAGLFVLLIGWLNVANLILARGQERQRELALLDALGAGRGRLLRLQLTEGVLFGGAAALLALPVTAIGQIVLRDAIPVGLRRYLAGWGEIGVDTRDVLLTGLLALVSVAAVAAWPALRASGLASRRLSALLHEGGRAAGAGRSRQRGRSALVVIEIALALVLTVAAGLTVRLQQRVLDGPQGYEPAGLATFELSLPQGRYADPALRRHFVDDLDARLAAIPGVESVAAANVLPATGSNTSRGIALAGEPEPEPNRAPEADLRTVAGDYFSTLRLPILAGRALARSDDAAAPAVAVVSRSMADRFWPGRDPLGQRFRAVGENEPWITVVGVAGDHLHHWFTRRSFPTFFVPFDQRPRYGASFAMRTERSPTELGPEIRAAVGAVDSVQPISLLRSQAERIHESGLGPRLVAGVMSVFAVLSLVLAISGVYAVMAYRVSLVARETGVRVALGATAGDVLRSTVGRALRLAGIGLAIGLAASVGVGRLIAAVMQGAGGFELPVALGSAALLAAAAFTAAVLPARRLLALAPADVLRSE